MAKFYIATTLSRHKEHNFLRDFLKSNGHEITYDWTLHDSVNKTDYKFTSDEVEKVAKKEFKGIEDADIVIVLLPGGIGTHTELGYALANKKIMVIHSEDKNDFSVDSKACPFYFDPLISRVVCPLKNREQILDEFNKRLEHKESILV